ncbi:RDD family protein [Mycoplasma marinum]|uniref:RDD domain-containing protein n=1 Tax=Mycoplasma marinum TaxID=1937190 RepID=A0A4R0XRM4_9MOLU|nr:RDD family protein [Mycoplasma marinum]TCG11525.1 hypothetical protein C4B24_01610 [Mycoplasma marinum]
MEVAKPAGLFKRLVARGIDFTFIAIISVGIIFIFTKPQKFGHSTFPEPWNFYVWSLITTLSIFLFMIAIPLATKGWSIGMKIMKIKITAVDDTNIYKVILKREIFFAFAWIFVSLLVLIVINHTLINASAEIKGYKNPTQKMTQWEKTRITFTGSISGLVWFAQMWLAITVIPNPEKRGWNDKFAHCQMINTNKKINKQIEEQNTIISPTEIENKIVEWIDTKEKYE